jgi:uncharacterized protein YehS (DUF1456 family)
VTNNDVLRRIRYAFDLRDQQVINIFALSQVTATLSQVKNWLRKDDDQQIEVLEDHQLSSFLNGFIIEKRGKRDGDLPKPEKVLTKNLILMKLKIALNLQADDIIAMFKANGLVVGKSELSAFFRKPDHNNYRQCKAQFLRNFLQGVQDKYRTVSAPQQKSPTKKMHIASAENSAKKTWQNNKKPNKTSTKSSTKSSTKTLYVNPNASRQAAAEPDKNERKTLKLKPSDIYKDA